MITHDSKFTFRCAVPHFGNGEPLVINAMTLRTAIKKARAKGWDVLRIRAVSGVPKHKKAHTIVRVCCPGCSGTFGVRYR